MIMERSGYAGKYSLLARSQCLKKNRREQAAGSQDRDSPPPTLGRPPMLCAQLPPVNGENLHFHPICSSIINVCAFSPKVSQTSPHPRRCHLGLPSPFLPSHFHRSWCHCCRLLSSLLQKQKMRLCDNSSYQLDKRRGHDHLTYSQIQTQQPTTLNCASYEYLPNA